jgi:hypothetical protein
VSLIDPGTTPDLGAISLNDPLIGSREVLSLIFHKREIIPKMRIMYIVIFVQDEIQQIGVGICELPESRYI